ncbi:IS3 family transposase [Sphingobacterium sp. BN32]|uniref:IS3 family transposase n=1 Tax=Sphingobacterium sp. BN32 TaxID=3058432 RepID=UPI003463B0E1
MRNLQKEGYAIARLCSAFGISRSGYYKGSAVRVSRDRFDKEVIAKVRTFRQEQPFIGSKKLYYLLNDFLRTSDIKLGRDGFHRLLRDHNLLIKRKRKYVSTTNSYHRFYTYGNLLRDRVINRPEQAYVSDITYLRTRQGFVYLFLLTDAYSRKIMGWNVSRSLGIEGGIKALKMALRNTKDSKVLIHHSDRGIQYCSKEYTRLLKQKKVSISMTEENHCYENSLAERVNGILKQEFMLDSEWPDELSVRRSVEQSIRIYNSKRPHWSLKLKTPQQVHEAA